MLSACRAPDVPVIPVSRARPPLPSRSRRRLQRPCAVRAVRRARTCGHHTLGTREEPGCPPCTAAPRITRDPGSHSRTLRPPPLHRRQRRYVLDSGGSSLTSRRDNRLPSVGNKTDEEPNKDFKKKQDHSSSQVGLLEAEKREKRVLERKMSEMEDDLKALTDLKFDNQRLKDENGALIRVISKLSK
ncbi:uncharacterized protein [Dendrobates tinctorius]|uniref:uncharacterized protein isoform X2 n=1 Tax=Dendrobates tinctorius TaxID=92724 RepID=UPI003CC963CE